MFWSNTADVFANSIVTTLGFGLGGATLCSLQRTYEARVIPEGDSLDPLTEILHGRRKELERSCVYCRSDGTSVLVPCVLVALVAAVR